MSFERLARILISGAVATFVPVALFVLLTGSVGFGIIALLGAVFYGLFVGLPLFIIAQFRLRINLMMTAILGFITGAVPDAIITWPPSSYAFKSFKAMDGTMYSIDGVTTLAGWLHFAQDLLPLGLLGMFAGAVFFFTLRGLGDPLTPGLRSSTTANTPEKSAT